MAYKHKILNELSDSINQLEAGFNSFSISAIPLPAISLALLAYPKPMYKPLSAIPLTIFYTCLAGKTFYDANLCISASKSFCDKLDTPLKPSSSPILNYLGILPAASMSAYLVTHLRSSNFTPNTLLNVRYLSLMTVLGCISYTVRDFASTPVRYIKIISPI